MKKLSFVLVFLLMIVGISQAEITNKVSSANIMGYSKVAIPPSGQYTLVGCNFQGVIEQEMTLDELFGADQLTQSPLPFLCDVVHFYNAASQSYSSLSQKTDGNFYYTDNWGGDPETNLTIKAGQAFWLQSPASASETNIVVLSGDAISAPSNSVFLYSGFNMISPPFSSDLTPNDENFLTSGATGSPLPFACDLIHAWTGSGFLTLGLKTDGEWYYTSDWAGSPADSEKIALGVGGWYEAKSGFTWLSTNHYSNLFE